MINAKLRIFSAACICLILTGVHINSAAWFRIKAADHYTAAGQCERAIRLYDKVLRKDKVKPRLRAVLLAKANLEKGLLASKFDMANLAIESYAAGSAKYKDIDPGRYENGSSLSRDRLVAIGLLEGGRFDKAAEEFQKLKAAYPNFKESQNYIASADDLEKRKIGRDDAKYFFLIGDTYIRNCLFEEAKEFYTKRILDYGISPLTVLAYLQKEYSKNLDIKHKVWGENIYVILEDFENIDIRLSRWLGGWHAKINNHYMTKDKAYGGGRSEFIDVTYDREEYDFWAKDVCIPLDNTNLNLGVRGYINSDKPGVIFFGIESIYPRQNKTGAPAYTAKRDVGNGWVEYRMDDLYNIVKSQPKSIGYDWETKGMLVGKIAFFNMRGISNKSYIDNIELYVID